MYKILSLKNYFSIFVLISALIMLTDLGLMILVELFIVAVFLYNIRSIHLTKEDLIVIGYVFYNLMSYFFSSYPLNVFLYTVRTGMIPIMMYFIAKTKGSLTGDFLKGMQAPIYFAVIVGLVLFLINPPFYWDFKCRTSSYSDLDNLGECTDFFELTRFSSFWSHSYCISALCLYLSLFMLSNIYKTKKMTITKIVGIFLLFFVMIIAQQRVVIAFYGLSVIIFSLYSIFFDKSHFKGIKHLLVLYLLSLVVIFFLVYAILGQEFVEYVIGRTLGYEGEKGMVSDRFATFSEGIKKISLFGEGLGKYSHGALFVGGMYAITDCDYIKIPCEIGICGFVYLYFIIIKGLFNSFMNFKIFNYEALILLFFPIAMIGASPFSATYFIPGMFWYCLGSVTYKMELIADIKKIENNL